MREYIYQRTIWFFQRFYKWMNVYGFTWFYTLMWVFAFLWGFLCKVSHIHKHIYGISSDLMYYTS